MAPDSPEALIKQGWLRAVLLLLVFVTCSMLAGTMAALILLGRAITAMQQLPTGPLLLQLVMLTVAFTAVLNITATVMFRRYIDQQPVKTLGFAFKPFQQDALMGSCLAIAMLGAATLLLFATRRLAWDDVQFSATDLLIGIAMMTGVAFTEEIVFRGYILNNLMASMNKWVALGVSAALFAFVHGTNPGINAVAVVNLLLAGLLLGINFIHTRNLWFAIGFHFSWNFVQGPVLGYEVSGVPLQSILQPDLNGAWWLTGGSFGIEGSFITTGLLLLSLLLLYYHYQQITHSQLMYKKGSAIA